MEATLQQEITEITTVFSESEIAEMENLFKQVGKDSLTPDFCKDLAMSFRHKQSGPLSFVDESMSRNAPQTSLVLRGGTASEVADLAFEAKSSRDNAWYDVASFLNHRVMANGELEARVRFAGFGVSHDEWVNIRTGIRERSIPLEPSECHKIRVGDLVLSYQERLDYALYVDAHVMEIQRRLHDIKGCRCIFVVRFDGDKTEEKLPLNKICCRPR
ncbi:Protein SAWADEE HOMEODOMAIN -like protein 1 [Bienertia sinuspersici]